MLNTVTLIGRFGADPEIRYTPSGLAVANFRVAVNDYWTGQNGEKQEKTHWFSCIAWKNLAETVEKYLSEGSLVGISGSLQQRSWQTDAGENRSTVEIVVRNLTILHGKKRDDAPRLTMTISPFERIGDKGIESQRDLARTLPPFLSIPFLPIVMQANDKRRETLSNNTIALTRWPTISPFRSEPSIAS